MKHNHATTCEHDIKVCDCCDSAYCTKCDKEWGAQKPCNLNHWPTYIPYYPQPVRPAFPYWTAAPWGTSIATGGTSQMGTNNIMQLSSTGANTQ